MPSALSSAKPDDPSISRTATVQLNQGSRAGPSVGGSAHRAVRGHPDATTHRENDHGSMLGTILFATDASSNHDAVIACAHRLAIRNGSKVVVVFVGAASSVSRRLHRQIAHLREEGVPVPLGGRGRWPRQGIGDRAYGDRLERRPGDGGWWWQRRRPRPGPASRGKLSVPDPGCSGEAGVG